MKKEILISAALLAALFELTRCSDGTAGRSPEKMIDGMVASMTLEQKAEYVIGTGMMMHFPGPGERRNESDSSARRLGWQNTSDSFTDTAYTQMVDRIRTYLPGAAGFTAEFPDLGITSQALSDGPAGVRIEAHATAFPIATLLASSWDTDLVRKVGETMGHELLDFGGDVILAPGMNIQRDPLCGRNFEYYSEDPLVTGKIAAAFVTGVQSSGVGTSVKHFAANNQETSRRESNSIVSARALREIYLKGFEIAVKEAHPWTVMSSYNKINGTTASQNEELLTDVLRGDWGFEGYVMTDWFAGTDVVAQMKAGNDLIMPGRPQLIKQLIEAVNSGSLDESVLDRNIKRILPIMMKTPRYHKFEAAGHDLKASAKITREAAAEGMVLLKNDLNTLPVSPADFAKVAAFGNASYEPIIGGTGSGDVNEAYSISLVKGLREGGFTPDQGLEQTYGNYIKETRASQPLPSNPIIAIMRGMVPLPEMTVSPSLARKMAGASDVAIITIGRNAGEGGDRKAEPGDFYLNQTELEMIRNITGAFHAAGKPAIVILNIAGVIETASWRDIPDAILCAWQPGQEAGYSITDVISGKVTPSGKLAVTFPLVYTDAPTARNFPGTPVKSDAPEEPRQGSAFFPRTPPMEVVYEEDIYVGYRYYQSFKVPVAYEFGYGLSYTQFEYSNLSLGSETFDGELTVSVDVTNAGSVAGKEAVQLYVSAPGKEMEKPVQELAAFKKTRLLEPGETETLTFVITASDIASFDETASSWSVEAGRYALMVGASSEKIMETADFSVAEKMNAGSVSRSLLPQQEINRLSVNR